MSIGPPRAAPEHFRTQPSYLPRPHAHSGLSNQGPTYKQRGVKQGVSLVSAPMSDIKVLFGQRLVMLRKAKNMSQETLANDSGLARSYLSSVERGLTNISVMNIELIADILDFEPYELLQFPKGWVRKKRKPKFK